MLSILTGKKKFSQSINSLVGIQHGNFESRFNIPTEIKHDWTLLLRDVESALIDHCFNVACPQWMQVKLIQVLYNKDTLNYRYCPKMK